MTDAELAALLAETAGKMALGIRASGSLSGTELGDAGDRAANEYLVSALRQHRPNDGLLSEELRDTPERLTKSRVWIVDPVDGTREYAEGRNDWAVHVALALDGVAAIGAVALPGLRLVMRSGAPAPLPPTTKLRMVVSRSRPPEEALAVAASLGAELLEMGSAGAKAMAIVRGEAEIYLHTGGQHEWDSCAPVAVALAHGLHASTAYGEPLLYNRQKPYMPNLLICRPEFARPVLDIMTSL